MTNEYKFVLQDKSEIKKQYFGLRDETIKTNYYLNEDVSLVSASKSSQNTNYLISASTSHGIIKNITTFPSYITDATIYSAELKIEVSASSKNVSTFNAKLYVPNEALEGENETIYARCSSGTLIDTYYVGAGSRISRVYQITSLNTIKNIMNYGVCLVSVDEASTDKNDTSLSEHLYLYEPEITLTYSSPSAPPKVEFIYPDSVDNSIFAAAPIVNPLNIKWDYEQSANTAAKKFELYYLNISGVDEPSLIMTLSGEARECTIDPITYPALTENQQNQEAQIALRGYVTDEIYTEITATIFLLPVECDELSPNNAEIILSEDTNTLKWDVSAVKSDDLPDEYYTEDSFIITDYPTHFDIQISTNSEESWTNIAENEEIQRISGIYSYDIPPNTLKSGITYWRVRPYINGYTINNYQSNIFVVRVNASTSSITCDGKPMPTLSWQSSAQVAYQVRFADYDSGAVYGTETSYTVPYFYADGKYPVQVRTQASNGEWSEWTETEYVTITNSPTENQIGLTVTPTRHAVLAEWTDSGESDNYILYRSGIPIYIGQNKSYTDIAANGRCTYFVRAVTGKYYAPSNTVIIEAYPRVDCLYDFAGETWIPLKHSLSPRSRAYSKNVNIVYNHYAGRAKPVAFTSGYSTRQMSGDYVFKNREEALKISDLSGKRVIFKDTRGGIIVGILNSVNINVESKLYPVTFTITETDYKEAVEYAAT